MHAIMGVILLLAPSQTGDAQLQTAQQRLETYLRQMQIMSISYEEQGFLVEGRRERPWGPPTLVELLYQYPSLRHKFVARTTDDAGVENINEVTTYIHRGRMTSVDHTLKLVLDNSSAPARPFEWLPFDAIGLRVMHTANTPLSDFLNCSDVVRIEDSTEIDGVTAEVYVVGPGIPDSVRPSSWGPESTVTMWLAPDYHHAPVRIEVAAQLGEKVRSFVHTASSFDVTEDLAGGATTYFPRQMSLRMGDSSIIRLKVSEFALNPRITLGEFIPRIADDFARTDDGQPIMIPRGKPAEPGVRDREKMRQAELLRIEPPRAGKRIRWDIGISIAGVLIGTSVLVFVLWIHQRSS